MTAIEIRILALDELPPWPELKGVQTPVCNKVAILQRWHRFRATHRSCWAVRLKMAKVVFPATQRQGLRDRPWGRHRGREGHEDLETRYEKTRRLLVQSLPRGSRAFLDGRPGLDGTTAYNLAVEQVDQQLEQGTLPFTELRRQLAKL